MTLNTWKSWIMVHCSSLDEDSIINSINAGHFYSSSGVEFKNFNRDQEKGFLEFEIKPKEGVQYITKIRGTMKGEENDPQKVGKVLAEIKGLKIKYELSDDDLYVRATVHSSKDHPNPSFKGQWKKHGLSPFGIFLINHCSIIWRFFGVFFSFFLNEMSISRD